ncbi:hypothetical protein CCMSSC00406_0009289 [Pleurotus cornucopiae]|uniref:Uncharacterized protein n=1 Tax=Pleurotus cornucopiae TaxID=5321 RepID=A0ACB7IVU2_PLECO|nr:hypothetical protein CCMSSC00406_0009289 [Pleurotus cornucopiae]
MASVFLYSPSPRSSPYLDCSSIPNAPPRSRRPHHRQHRKKLRRLKAPRQCCPSPTPSSVSFNLSPHPALARIMSDLEKGFGLPAADDSIAPSPAADSETLTSPDEDFSSGNQTIPTATMLTREQYASMRDPTPHPKLQNVTAVNDMPYSYKFTNPLSGAQFTATITDVWAIIVVAGHLRKGKHIKFYREHYSDVYYNLVKCINQEAYLQEKNCQLPLITEDGFVLMLGTHNPSAFVLGLVDVPDKGRRAKDDVMKRPIPRHSKASRKESPPPVASPKPPLPPPTSTNPLSVFARMNPETLARGMISYTEYIDKKMQRIESAKLRARANYAARHHHNSVATPSPPSLPHISRTPARVFNSNGDVTMSEVSSSDST